MKTRLEKVITALRSAENEVNGDFKNVYGDRRLQCESWLRTVNRGWEYDAKYYDVAVTEFERMVGIAS